MGELIEELREAADQERHASTYLADLMSRAADALSSQSVRVKELEGELTQAYRVAVGLAAILHSNYYSAVVDWRPAEDVIGVLLQIDNMVAGIAGRLSEAEALAQRRGKALEPFARIAELHLGAPFDEEHVVHLKDAHGFIAELFVRPFREASRALHLPEVEG
jgi:hypothetical protein